MVPLADVTAIRHTLDGLLDTCREQRLGVEVTSAHLVHELILNAQQVYGDPHGARDAAILAALRKDACCPISVGEQAGRLGVSLNALRTVVRRSPSAGR